MAGCPSAEQACDDSPYPRRCRPDPGRDCHDPPDHPRAAARRPPRPAPRSPDQPARPSSWTPRSCSPTPRRSTASPSTRWCCRSWSSPSWRASGTTRSWAGSPGSRCACSTSCGSGTAGWTGRCPPTSQGGTLRVELNHTDDGVLPPGFRNESNDARILSVALNLAAEGREVTLVSKDMPLRVKAASVGPARRRVPARPGQRPDLDRHGRAGAGRGGDRPALRRRDARPGRRRRPALPHRAGAALGAGLGARPGAARQDGPAGPRRPGGVRRARPLGRAADRAGPAAGRVDRDRLARRPGRHRQVRAGALRRAGGGDGAPPAQEGDRLPPALRGRRPGAGLPARLGVGEDVALGAGGLRHPRRGGARERAGGGHLPRACSRCCR